MIDPNAPVATPFRANWATAPRTDYEFRTGIITAADGREQRRPQNRFPRVRVSYDGMALGAAHAGRIEAALPGLMNRAVALRDFRMNGQGAVSADGGSVVLDEWGASWAVGVRVVIEDRAGMFEHAAVIASADPASRTLALDAQAPIGMRGRRADVGSAVSCSLDDGLGSRRWHGAAASFAVAGQSFGGVDQIGGAPLAALPFRHGGADAAQVKYDRKVSAIDHGVGRRAEALNYASWTSGFRTHQIEAIQMTQAEKEALVSFWCGHRGRLRSFMAPHLMAGARFRFASDILAITHHSGEAASATLNVVQVVQ